MIIGAYLIYLAYQKPKKIKEWLVWACAYAEKKLGSGTGMIKLREVYDMFTAKYPIISFFITFNKFSEWAEDSLKIFKDWLENNPKAQEFFTSNYVEEKNK